MNFTFTQSTVDLISQFEGCILHPYKDSVGIPTIGIGNTTYPDGTKVAMDDDDITHAQALEYLLSHLNKIILPVFNSHIIVDQNQNQIDSLASLVYNIGVGGFIKSHVLGSINNQDDIDTIKTNWLQWKNAGGKPILLPRREKEFQNYIS